MRMETNNMTGAEFLSLLGVTAIDYKDFPGVTLGHDSIDLHDYFSQAKAVIPVPKGVERVAEGRFNSGEIWMDTSYDVVYLYIGKLPEGQDVVLNMGGDTGCTGCFEVGIINDENDDSKIFFDVIIYTPL